jgi:membrane-bound serine protease (ClpP class)
LDDLLAKLDGRVAETSIGPQTVATRGVDRKDIEKNVLEHFLEFISDPNVSFILLTVGGLGIVIELFNPGLIVPAVVGVICLLLAFLAVGNLPVNWAGVVFILLAVALAGFEVAVSGFGVLGIGAVISLVVGGLLLFTQFGDASPALPPVSVSRWLVGGTGAVAALTLGYFVRAAVQSRREGHLDAASLVIGQVGTVTGTLGPRGVVRVANETWTAVSEDGTVIEIGESVQVTSVEGLVLAVSRQERPGS